MKNKKYIIKLTVILAIMLAAFAVTAFAGIHGDVNNDNSLTPSDARLALRASVSLEHYAEGSQAFIAADVDGDHKVTSSDARSILRAAVNLEDLDHIFGEKTYTSQNTSPTCTEGTEYYTECKICGEKITGSESKLGHDKSDRIESESKAATCTKNGTDVFRCLRCGEKFTATVKAAGHKMNISNATCTKDKVCTVCGEVFEHSFNNSVNVLKDGTHTFSGFSYRDSSVTTGSEKMTFSTVFKSMLKLMGSAADEDIPTEKGLLNELKAMIVENFTEDSGYSFPVTDVKLTNYNFNLIGKDEVSLLADTDVKSIKRETVNGIDFLKELDDSIPVYKSQYSLGRFKAAKIGEVSKVTVVLNDDRYSLIKDSSKATGIMNITGMNLRELAEGFNLSINDLDETFAGMDDAFGMKCKDGTASATVTYYFDKKDNSPIAAKYDTAYSLDASCYIKFTGASVIALLLGEGADEEIDATMLEEMAAMFGFGPNDSLIDGYVDFKTNFNETQFYFFDDYFPAK